MKVIIWSKDQCTFCDQAKRLLETRDIDYEERNINRGSRTKEQLLEAVPQARSVPQIFVDDEYVGGFNELREILDERE